MKVTESVLLASSAATSLPSLSPLRISHLSLNESVSEAEVNSRSFPHMLTFPTMMHLLTSKSINHNYQRLC